MSTTIARKPTVLQYGPGSVGKTVQSIRAVPPERTFFLALEPGAFTPLLSPELNPWRSASGKLMLPPTDQLVSCVDRDDPEDQVVRAVEQRLAPMVERGRVGAVVVSTVSAWAERMYDRRMGRTARDNYQNNAMLVARVCRDLMYRLFELDVIVIAEAHERPFTQGDDGRVKTGGPKLVPHDQSTQGFLTPFDTVLRARYTLRPGVRIRERFYECDPGHPEHEGRMRDRWDVCRAVEPMDLRTILRRVNARAKGLELPPPAEFAAAPSNGADAIEALA